MGKTQIICRRMKLILSKDELGEEQVKKIYKFISDGQYVQYKALNFLSGELYSRFFDYDMDFQNSEFKDYKKEILRNTNPILNKFKFPIGLDTKSLITRKVDKDFSAAIKNGLMKGERSAPSYRRNTPLLTRGRDLKFRHEYQSIEELENHITDKDLKITLHWVHNYEFEVCLGYSIKNAWQLRQDILSILKGEYKIKGSSIEVVKTEIFLNLSMEIPKKAHKLDENTVVGVDLGLKIPAVCAVNNSRERKYIGDINDFFRVRTKLQSQYTRTQRSLKLNTGGHGRKKKMQALNRLKDKEKNFANCYNHNVSKAIVEFAVSVGAKYIHLEDLSGFDSDQTILRNWSFYQLQNFITYKAERVGIIVKKVNPAFTSQTCSRCGNLEDGQREKQKDFKCKKCGYYANADYNAAKNISLSTDFTDEKEKSESAVDLNAVG